MTRAVIFGAGSWGSAFSMILADAGVDVVLWGRREELCETIRRDHVNPDYLPGIALPPTLDATSNAVEALEGRDVVVMAMPSQSLRANLESFAASVPKEAVVVSLMKGVELGTSLRMTEVISQVLGRSAESIAAVSGPNLALEVAQRQPAASVVACPDETVARRLQADFSTEYFRVYTNPDVVGVELGGSVKNVIALACGIAEGLGFGANTKASIITRGLAETTRLGLALGADATTFSGLAGLGDLVATCNSPLSRNRSFGEKVGRGEDIDQVVADSRQIAEGVRSCESILELARCVDVEMPIVEGVVSVVQHRLPPRQLVRHLMTRSMKPE